MASPTCNRYDIHWVDLEPVRGSELHKTRPAAIVSLDVLNRVLETVVVCPLTTALHPGWRSRLPVTVAGKKSEIAADQIRTISKQRLGSHLGRLSSSRAQLLRLILSEMYGEP